MAFMSRGKCDKHGDFSSQGGKQFYYEKGMSPLNGWKRHKIDYV